MNPLHAAAKVARWLESQGVRLTLLELALSKRSKGFKGRRIALWH